MARITQALFGIDEKIFPHVTAESDRSVDWELKPQIFDSIFTKSIEPGKNCSLKIVLRPELRQLTPKADSWGPQVASKIDRNIRPDRHYGHRADANERSIMVMNWTTEEWDEFIQAFANHAAKWDRKFWLMPPDDFDLLDFKFGNSTFRPNVVCEFKIDFEDHGRTHIKIEAANVYDPKKSRFRSHMTLYSSDARNIGERASIDPINGTYRAHTNYSTIVHEIGHALGLPHIGVIRSRPNCNMAIVLDDHYVIGLIGPMTAALLKGGRNSNACYGSMSAFDDADNVMGMGSKFAPENAKPWLDRLPYHFRKPTSLSKWKVSMVEVPPMSLIGFEEKAAAPAVTNKMQGSPKIGEGNFAPPVIKTK